jgi:hypothetical protein
MGTYYHMKTTKNIYLLLVLSLFFSCTQEKSLPNAYSKLQRQKGEMLVASIPASRSGQYWSTPVAGGNSNLLLGSYDNTASSMVIFFKTLSNIDTNTVYSAKLILEQFSHTGSGADFSVKIYPVTVDWDETSVTWADLESGYDSSQLLGELTISAVDTAEVSDSISVDMVNKWVKEYWIAQNGGSATTLNKGILLVTEHPTFMANFYSTDYASSVPTLQVYYRPIAGGIDTVSVSANLDASLLKIGLDAPKEKTEENTNSLTLSNGWGYRSMLYFNVSKIPLTATIHQAVLALHIASDQSRTTSDGMTITALPIVADSTWTATAILADSVHTAASTSGMADSSMVSFSSSAAATALAGFVQKWTLGTTRNYGFLLQPSLQGYNLDKLVFYTGKSDSTLAPMLKITYSLPPTSKFE